MLGSPKFTAVILMNLKSMWRSMTRKKALVITEKTELNRIMSVFDLVFLGIGSMLGMGVYIMSGSLAKTAGPAMVLSFLLAGFAATLSALCYAEFAGRAPGTGSAYAYCYITVGEFMAFLLGWNLALEFVIGTACLARGLSGYLDSITQESISKYLTNSMGINVDFLSPYPDFLAFSIMVIFSILVSIGVKASTTVNNTLVIINLVTISILTIVGIIKANTSNWSIAKEDIPLKFRDNAGQGGFVPYGFSSILEAAATAFYAYTGFDTVATTGGEARNPQRAIPIALMLSMGTAISVYTLISATFTLMWPYYDQNTVAPYPYILNHLDLQWVKWVVTIGAVSAILGCIVGSIFGMARIVYSISYDGLLFSPLAKVNSRTKTPVTSTMVSGVLTGIISIVFDADQLISMTSIGTLMAYTMVGVCVLLLRYEQTEESKTLGEKNFKEERGLLEKMFNLSKFSKPNQETANTARIGTYFLSLFAFLLSAVLAFWTDAVFDLKPFPLTVAIFFALLFIITMIVINCQPSSTVNLIFKVKPVPLLPAISIFINIYLMLKLDKWTWIRFVIWLILGLIIYFGYGIWNSKERDNVHLKKTDSEIKK